MRLSLFHLTQLVRDLAVNEFFVGSNPTGGANAIPFVKDNFNIGRLPIHCQ